MRVSQEWRFQAPDGGWIEQPVRGNLRCNSTEALKNAALGGVGILLCPTFYIGDELAQGRLVELLPEYRAPEISIYAIYPQRRQLAPKVRAFVDFLAERIPADPPWDAFRHTRVAGRARR